jgi:hypothetical protein
MLHDNNSTFEQGAVKFISSDELFLVIFYLSHIHIYIYIYIYMREIMRFIKNNKLLTIDVLCRDRTI